MHESVIYQDILVEGEQKGEQAGIRKVAINMLKMGMSIEQIANATNLSAEQIKQIQQAQE